MSRMLKFGQPLGGVMQIAHIVDDLEAGAAKWVEALNIGPWVILEHFQADNTTYYGEPTNIDLSIALAYSGSMCFELVQQNNDVPSVYKDQIAQSGLGAFHHWGVCTETFDEDLAAYKRKDMPIAFAGNVRAVGGLRFAYIDAMASARGMIELIECAPVVEDLFNSIKEQAEAWDGKTVFIRP